jgi:transposase
MVEFSLGRSVAKEVGINNNKIILLVEDNAGWHRSQKVKIPEGIIVDFLPAYSPELQTAERLWSLVDEPLVNEYFETIEEI